MGLYLSGTFGDGTSFDPSRPATPTLTSVTQATTSAIIVASNPNRRFVSIFNAGTKTLYIAFGPTASLTSYTLRIPKDALWESQEDGYTGDISGLWDGAGAGAAKVTEVTT